MQQLTRTNKGALLASVISCLLLTANVCAQIVTDGSVGPAENLSGPNFSIPESLGSRPGTGVNLFHSFQHFNILTGESATFTGASEIANVISRVTGGNPSTIDGILRSTIGQADFYFLNPAGVMFGANAQVDVPGSFYVSTADQLRFADGAVYHAKNSNTSTLSFDQPESFGFLGDQTARISVVGSNLVLTPGKTLSLTGGELEIDRAQLSVERGGIQLVATGDAVSAITMEGGVSTPAQGKLTVTNSQIDVSGDGAGRIVIRGGASQITSSEIFADNNGPTKAGSEQGIDIHATSLEIASSFITTDTFGGDAANLSMVVAGDLSIVNGGGVGSSTSASGNAGQVIVTASKLTIDGQGSDLTTGILSNTQSNLGGDAGTITVTVDGAVSIVHGGQVRSGTDGTGDAGQVSVTAGTLTVDRQGGKLPTRIASLTAPGSGGNANTVTVEVTDALSIANGGEITSSTFGNGDGGPVSVTASTLTIDGQSNGGFTGISSQANSGSSGKAGAVTVNVNGALSMVNRGIISSSTFDKGDAGRVSVAAHSLTIDGRGSDLFTFTGIASQAGSDSQGQAGSIRVDAQNLSLVNGGVISIESGPTVEATTLATIKPTEINIMAQNIILRDSSISTESFGNVPAGSITLNVADTLSLDPSRISTAANNADGGAISIRAKVIDLQDSQITTSVRGQGDGGDIDLNARVLVLDGGFIQANTAGANARGGDIRINTEALVASQNLLLTGGNTPLSFQPGLNVIQAAAPDGVSGNIDITSPQLDISGDLTDLEAELLDIDQLAQDPCATSGGRQSRLARLGRGGLPVTPEQAGSVVIDSDRLQRLLPRTDAARDLPFASARPIARPHGTLTIEPLWISAQSKTEC